MIITVTETICTCNWTHKTRNEFLIKKQINSPPGNEFTKANCNAPSFRAANSTILLMGIRPNPLCHRPAAEQRSKDHYPPQTTWSISTWRHSQRPLGSPRDFSLFRRDLALPRLLREIRSQMRKTRTVSWINSL